MKYDLNDYFDPVSIEKPDYEHLAGPACFSHNITIHTESNPISAPEKYAIAIFGVPEERNSPNAGCEKAPEAIRQRLYSLARVPGKTKMIDLGNMKRGTNFSDTISGLADLLAFLAESGIVPVIIGGSSALIPAVDRCFSTLGEYYTLASIDSRIDFHPGKSQIDSFSYLNKIIYNSKSNLRHFINIGYQTYLNDLQSVNRLIRRKADLMRIGDVRESIHLTEPLLRDSEAVMFDIAAVRESDAPGTVSPSPNGFYGEEICLLARYAGISDKIKFLGLFEVNPLLDRNNQTAGLAAQIIWFFLEGFGQKQNETPLLGDMSSGRFTRYHVQLGTSQEEIIFVKSNITERWWIEIPEGNNKFRYMACAYEDYMLANHNEIPPAWIKATKNSGR